MRAVAVSAFGAEPELMDLPQPEPGPGEVLVAMAVAGLNPTDWKIADGMLKDAVPHSFPLVLGADGAGEVVAVGPDVRRCTVGDQVFGQFQLVGRGGGSYADYAIAAEDAVAPAPRNVTYATSAAVPTAGTAAYNLVEETRVAEGKRVLVVGATGGVGTFVTQLAAQRGAEVIATARAGSAELMGQFGAAATVDHTEGPVAQQVLAAHPDGVDILIDLVSGESAFADMTQVVRDGGTVVSTVGAADTDMLIEHNLRGFNFGNRPSPQLLSILADQLDAGRLTVLITSEVQLEDAPAALARSRTGRAQGKTVIGL
ncbi:NADP-dependent oxidoreductase [Streptomyces violens]|uniref:NADP-dependent oxidoreductase n=1 Tax=Streptomyces violens TaxID=66377 RepID=UPI0004BECF2C|nr:NADP-dependent oxidoreductase [Streptomyces violens]